MLPLPNSFYEKNLKRLYTEVVKDFPKIREKDISTDFNISVKVAGLIYRLDLDEYGDWKVDFILAASRPFFDMSESLKKGTIAHELGHYVEVARRPNLNNIMRKRKWIGESKYYTQHKFKIGFYKLFNKKEKHKDHRIKQWYLLSEMYADNQAFEAGYGKELLGALKYLISKGANKKYAGIRIKNLEEKLR